MHVVKELVDQKLSVCLIDPNGIAGGASGTPVGLANPATGRYASRSWEAETSLNYLTNSLLQIQSTTTENFFKQTGVLRPAFDSKIASRMKQNIDQDLWDEGSIEWLLEDEIKLRHPGIHCYEGGVWVPKGLTVHIPIYLEALFASFENTVPVFTEVDYQIEHSDNWIIRFQSNESIEAKHVVFTSGIWTSKSDFWSHLDMHPVKGQTLIIESHHPFKFAHAVSALGYFSRIDGNKYILGSTYEHNFDHDLPDQKGEDYMLNRLEKVLPDLAATAKVVSKWAGIRASTPDKKPYIGAHPTSENCYVFTGLGSKGLLYSSYGAHLLIDHILKNSYIPDELSLNRFQ